MGIVLLVFLGGLAISLAFMVWVGAFALESLYYLVFYHIPVEPTIKAIKNLLKPLSRVSTKGALVIAAIPFLLSTSFAALLCLLCLIKGASIENVFALGTFLFIFTTLPAIGIGFPIFLGLEWVSRDRKEGGREEALGRRARARKIEKAKEEYGPMLHHLLESSAGSEGWHGPPLPHLPTYSLGAKPKRGLPEPCLCSKQKVDGISYRIEPQLGQWLDGNPGGDKIQFALEWEIQNHDQGGYHDWRIWLLLTEEWKPTSFVVAHRVALSADWEGHPLLSDEERRFTIEACTLSEESLERGFNKTYSKVEVRKPPYPIPMYQTGPPVN